MFVRILKLPAVLLVLALTAGSVAQARIPIGLGIPSFWWGLAAGIVVLVIAVAIASAAMAEMSRHRTTVEPGRRPASLVTSGVFAWTRNPIYLAMLLVVLAIAMMTNGAWFVLAAVALCIALDRVVIRSEERMIGEAFGAEYDHYKRRVRRWV